ncbi:MAG: hypothetical protein C0490_21945 [Marivirga sp.]|nr:hypothetical protein [Marivirga sp.]
MRQLAHSADGSSYSSWDVFPHQVLTGRSHFDPNQDRIRKVWFSTGDIYRIFDDFDSFGTIREPSEQLQSLIPKKIGNREVPIDKNPMFVYFAGRSTVLATPLSFGKFEVQHWPFARSDNQGAKIITQMRIQLEFGSAVTLSECLKKLVILGQFLNLVAGRSQVIENVQIELDKCKSKELPLSLHWILGPIQVGEQELDEPSRIDMPLDGVRRAEEFSQVIEQWFKSEDHTLARARLNSCRERGNCFDVDRLVAAANLFDLTVTLKPLEIPKNLTEIRKNCLDALRALPRSDERDSAIMALSRIGAPSLMKKVLSRAAIVCRYFSLEDLDKVLRQAVKCRNYFVHGPGDNSFNFPAVERHTIFLTETLEFVFAAAELIDCGWNANNWRHRPHTGNHWFSRYISHYDESKADLFSDIERSKKSGSMNQ